MKESKRKEIRFWNDLYYDLQKARLAAEQKVDQIEGNIAEAKEDGLIDEKKKIKLQGAVEEYLEDNLDPAHLESLETEIKGILEAVMSGVHIWEDFLKPIKGMGATLASGLIAYLRPEEADYPSSFRKYCCYHVEPDGTAPVRERGKRLKCNTWMLTLGYKIGNSFIRQRTPKYRDIYDSKKIHYNKKMRGVLEDPFDSESETRPERCPNYEECAENVEKKAERADREPKDIPCRYHIDMMARRPMIQQLLDDLWLRWRKIEGLPLREPYEERDEDWEKVQG